MRITLSGLICLFLSMTSSCQNVGNDIKSLFSKQAPTTKTVVILYDTSGSAKSFGNLYLDSFKRVLSAECTSPASGKLGPCLGNGDVLVVAKITDRSITEPEIPIEKSFPAFDPRDANGNRVDNRLIVARLSRQATEALAEDKRQLLRQAEGLFLGDPRGNPPHGVVSRTDIMSSLSLAEKILKRYKHDKSILLIFSDMIEDSTDYNFAREQLTDRGIQEIIGREKTKGRLPDLKGVRVYVVAPALTTSDRFFQVQKFWLAYFPETGADLPSQNYCNSLLHFSE